jgi:hypothetical protein
MAKIGDRLSHHYHRVDQNQLWNVATTDIPALVEQLRADKPTLGLGTQGEERAFRALLTDPWVMTDRGGRACGRRG